MSSIVGPIRYTKLGRVTTLPITDVHFGPKPSLTGFLQNLLPENVSSQVDTSLARINPTVESMRQGFEDLAISAARARKPADPNIPLGFLDKVKEFIHFHAPKVNMGLLSDMLSRAKGPLLATLGVAAAAGLAYLAYKIYKNRHEIPGAVNKLMEDIRSAAPDLLKVQGWAESIRKNISDTLHEYADDPSKLVNKLAQLKNTILGHQTSIAPVGQGINIIVAMKAKKRPHKGAGIRVPII